MHLRYTGDWWIPEYPERRIPGVAEFHPEARTRLELAGILPPDTEDSIALRCPRIIVGETSDGFHLTLYGARGSGRSMSKGPAWCYHEFEYLIMGQFQCEADLVFDSVCVEYSRMAGWIDAATYRVIHTCEERRVTIEYDEVQPRWMSLGAGMDLCITVEPDVSRIPKLSECSSVEEIGARIRFYLVSDSPRHLNAFIVDIDHLASFFTFALGAPVVAEKIAVSQSMSDGGNPNASHTFTNLRRSKQNINIPDSWLSGKGWPWATAIRDSIDTLVPLWFSRRDHLEALQDLYIDLLTSRELSRPRQILSLAQALECYDRATSIDRQLVPDGDSRSGRRGNKTTFRARMQRIIERFADGLPHNSAPPIELAAQITDLRNKLSHGAAKRVDIERIEVVYLCGTMYVLLEACVLSSVGFPDADICRLLRQLYPNQISAEARVTIG